ncbi:MAG TPA: MarR family transcriptional regulator [Patescibacteria group bacterium]|nr:MarR family transcriptional regulator [Patescibacteria group bacterium]
MDINLFVEKMLSLYPRIARAIAHHETDYLAQGKITLPQFWALDYLYGKGVSTMTELSRYLRISRAAMTGLVDRMLAQGFIVREKTPKDRRIVRIAATPKGRSIIENIRKQKHKSLERIFSQISSRDRAEYVRILEQVVAIVGRS